MKIITESEMNFGEYDEADLFYIEDSKIYKDLGSGIKTVEFILKYNEKSIIFLEAKKSCPNVANRYESKDKEQKFEEFFSHVTEKFLASLQIYLAALLERFADISEVGTALQSVDSMRNIQMKFVLVIKDAVDVSWLAGPLAELKARLLPIRKIWGIDVVVINEEMARQLHLMSSRVEKNVRLKHS